LWTAGADKRLHGGIGKHFLHHRIIDHAVDVEHLGALAEIRSHFAEYGNGGFPFAAATVSTTRLKMSAPVRRARGRRKGTSERSSAAASTAFSAS
jgi:hypothetical protein